MIERKLAELPEDKRQKIADAFAKDPAFFSSLAKEIDEEKKTGKNDMAAVMAVVGRHKDKLRDLFV